MKILTDSITICRTRNGARSRYRVRVRARNESSGRGRAKGTPRSGDLGLKLELKLTFMHSIEPVSHAVVYLTITKIMIPSSTAPGGSPPPNPSYLA